MTEDQARQKWCPFVRVTVTPNDNTWQGNMLTNRGEIPAAAESCACVASDCAAWRWAAGFDPRGGDYANDGYCGLVGKP